MPLSVPYSMLRISGGKDEHINHMQYTVTHLFGFRRGLVPDCFEFGNHCSVFLEVIDHEEVTSKVYTYAATKVRAIRNTHA
jgi:hypothetical protein